MSEHAQRSDLIDLTLHLHAKSSKAILVSETGDAVKAVWLPVSQIEVIPGRAKSIVVVTLPEWMAVEKGLV